MGIVVLDVLSVFELLLIVLVSLVNVGSAVIAMDTVWLSIVVETLVFPFAFTVNRDLAWPSTNTPDVWSYIKETHYLIKHTTRMCDKKCTKPYIMETK